MFLVNLELIKIKSLIRAVSHFNIVFCEFFKGLVLLLMTKNPDLSFEEIRAAVISGTYRNLPSRNLTCLGVKDTDYPNYVYGYGRVNALNSLGLVNSRK